MVRGLAVVGLVILICKLAISKLRGIPRDELRGGGALRNLGFGLAGGTLLFSSVTAVAALVGLYANVGAGSARSALYALMVIAIIPAVLRPWWVRSAIRARCARSQKTVRVDIDRDADL